MAITDKLAAIADAIRSKTGKADALTLDQMPGEIERIQAGGGGGTGLTFGENTVTPSFLNVFHALESGTAVTGEFTFARHLPNTETLIFDTGLDEIHGIFYVDCDYAYTGTGATPEYAVWGLYMANPNGLANVVAIGLSTYNTGGFYFTGYNNFIARGKWRIDGGALYVTADYNNNQNYTPFYRNHRYKWVAW